MSAFRWRPLIWTLIASFGVFLASCGGSGSSSTPAAPSGGATATPSPTPTPSGGATPTPSPTATPTPAPVAASTTYPVAAAGTTVQFQTVAGYSASFCYPSNNAPSGATFTVTTTTVVPTGVTPNPQATGTPFLYLEITGSATVAYNSNPDVSPVTLPASFSTTGLTFYQSIYDGTTGTPFGTNNTGTVSGNSITFGNCGTQPSGPTITGGHPTVIVISHS